MAIGAISAYGAMSAVSFRPYVYNANTVNASSMNKLSRISDDVLDKKIDYNELTDESLNENPLKKGQTLNFQDMLAMQMSRGQSAAARIMRPMEKSAEDRPGTTGETAVKARNADTAAARFPMDGIEDVRPAAAVETDVDLAADANGGNINYQMQQALRAYEMFMTA